jgi:hypothetical protein
MKRFALIVCAVGANFAATAGVDEVVEDELVELEVELAVVVELGLEEEVPPLVVLVPVPVDEEFAAAVLGLLPEVLLEEGACPQAVSKKLIVINKGTPIHN